MREVDIINFIGKDYTRVQIGEELGLKWDVSPISIQNQYDKVIRKLSENLSKERELLAVQLIERNNEIYRLCMASKKYKTALDANNLNAKISGLYHEKALTTDDTPKIITIKEEDQSKPKLVSVKKAADE